jgi:hypothetical protein
MTLLASILSLLVLQGSSFRIGFAFDGSFPSMADEKDYADLLNEAGLSMELERMAWTGGIEALGDVSNRIRLRGAVTTSNYYGAYKENYDPLGYALVGIFTGGLAFLFGTPTNDVISLADESLNIEAAVYYRMVNSPALFIGGGPTVAFASRAIDTPETSFSEDAFGMGFNAGIRIDQESGGRFLGIPLLFGAEAGYRYCNVKFDEKNTKDFSLNFSGPYLRVGTYVNF